MQVGFYWLVGDIELEDTEVDFNGRKETWRSAVKIKKCRYLEVSGCKGTCVNMWWAPHDRHTFSVAYSSRRLSAQAVQGTVPGPAPSLVPVCAASGQLRNSSVRSLACR